MKILRLSTFSLTLAVAVFGFGYTNPAFADKPGDGGHNHDDDSGFPTGLTVQFSGGAFVSVNPALGVTAEAEVKLSGDEPLRMFRPGFFDPALMSWNDVFDLCGLLGPSGMVEVPEFTAQDGRKGWAVEKVLDT